MKLYIAVLNEVPDYIVPTLVAHTMLAAHLVHAGNSNYDNWIKNSFKKCVVRVNQKEFDKIAAIPGVYLGHENKTLDGVKSCAIPVPCVDAELPNVLKFAKLWKPVPAPAVEPPRQGYISPELLKGLQDYSESLDKTKINEFIELYHKSSKNGVP